VAGKGSRQGWWIAVGVTAAVAVAACGPDRPRRVDVSLTSTDPGEARAYGRAECARRADVEVVRVHVFDPSAPAADAYREVDVNCPVAPDGG
jgi:hypothetical protein